MNNKSPHEIDLYVGRRIRQFRKAQKISSTTLAQLIGKTYQQIQKYETAQNRVSAGTLYQIARLLDCQVSDFFPDPNFLKKEPSLNDKKRTVKQFKKLFNQLIGDI